MKRSNKKALHLLALSAITLSIFSASALTVFAADAACPANPGPNDPPCIDFSFNDSGSTSADSGNDAPPSLVLPPDETTGTGSTGSGTTGTGSTSTGSTSQIASTGPEIFALIPASLILGYAVSRRRK